MGRQVLQPDLFQALIPGYHQPRSPLYFLTDMFLRVLSPYEFNPLNLNPLRDVLARHVDFTALRKRCPVHLYLCATNVETGNTAAVLDGDIQMFIDAELKREARG